MDPPVDHAELTFDSTMGRDPVPDVLESAGFTTTVTIQPDLVNEIADSVAEKPLIVERHPHALPVPERIGECDELWKKANKLAQSKVQDQATSMNGSLDTALIFVSFRRTFPKALLTCEDRPVFSPV